MKNLKAIFAIFALLVTVSCSDEGSDNDYTIKVLTFEDEDYKGNANYLGSSSWSSLIESDESGYTLLNSDTKYYWTDYTTYLYSEMGVYTWGGYDYAYSSGGIAISNYFLEVAEGISYDRQLSIPEGESGAAGYNGSENFAVVYGSSWGAAPLSFVDGAERVVDHLYVANTSYMSSVCKYDEYNALGEDDDAWVVATGYDAAGEVTGSLKFYLAEDGEVKSGWNRWDLSSLGEVAKIEFVCDSDIWSDSNNGYDSSLIPTYFAIDNVAVRF